MTASDASAHAVDEAPAGAAPIEERANRGPGLSQHERFLDSIIEHVPDMIFVKDARELRFLRFNRAGEELLGFPRADLLGKNDYDFFPKEEADFFIERDREVLRSGRLIDIPSEPIHTRSRGVRFLHTKKIPIMGDDGAPLYLLGISEDITDRKSADEERARHAEDLARSNQELEQFAYVASHDLQEPLRKIQTFGDILKRTSGAALGAEGQDFLERMLGAATRMRALVTDLLVLSRVTSQSRPFHPVDLGEVVRATLGDLEVAITQSGAQIEIVDLPIVDADLFQMAQLFQNLIGNALKFQREGEPPRIRVAGRVAGPNVEITFEDHGIGFDDKYAERIFRPFQRLHGRDRYPGTGMGLSICRKIVERHGGTIRATATQGQGATFVVSLPARRDTAGGELR